MIKYAENFQYDTPTSILQRYPGTQRGIPTIDEPNSFPLTRSSRLVFPNTPFVGNTNRIEIVLQLSNTNPIEGNNDSFYIFGLELKYSSNKLYLHGNQIPIMAGSYEELKLHIIIERINGGNLQIIILYNDEVVVTPTILLLDWIPTNFIGGLSYFEPTVVQYRLNGFMSWLNSVIVAVDTPTGTRINQVNYEQRALLMSHVSGFNYTNTGYNEDIDKNDPALLTPNINAGIPATIVYDMEPVANAEFTNIYASTSSSLAQDSIIINGSQQVTSEGQRAVQVHSTTDTSVRVHTEEQPGTSNDDGVRFFGEITYDYAEFARLVSVNNNRAGNKWLSFQIDGKHVLFSMTDVHYSSANAFREKGLSVGLEYPPYGINTPQLVIIELDSIEYIVRYPMMFSTNNAPVNIGTNPISAQRSEWVRLMYPIVNQASSYYSGRRLAYYEQTSLRLQVSNYATIGGDVLPTGVPFVYSVAYFGTEVGSTTRMHKFILERIDYADNEPPHIMPAFFEE